MSGRRNRPRPSSNPRGGDGSVRTPLAGRRVRYAPTYVPGVGALWHLIDEGGRGIVSDWLEDRGLDIERIHPLPF